MRGYVGVTDGDWYHFLADRPEVSSAEVNFWRPGGGRGFRALAQDEPFFFKTHAPHNRVVGGGFYSGFAALRVSEAWQMFGLANSAASLDIMRERIAYYRREPIAPGEDPEIGCVFVRCAPTCTQWLTAVTSRSTITTACWSARDCAANSAMATSSTPKPASSSSYQTERSTGRIANSSNGTSTPCSKRRDHAIFLSVLTTFHLLIGCDHFRARDVLFIPT